MLLLVVVVVETIPSWRHLVRVVVAAVAAVPVPVAVGIAKWGERRRRTIREKCAFY